MIKEIDSKKAQKIIKNSCTAFLIINEKGIIKYASPAISNFNWNLNSILDISFIELIKEKDIKKVREKINKVLSSDSLCELITFQSANKRKSLFLEATLQNFVKKEDINGILVTIRDISNNPKISKLEKEINQRKHLQKQLNENKERYELLIDHANEGICVAQNGVLKFANPKLCDMLKATEKDLIFKPFTEFIHPDDQSLVTKRYTDRLKGKDVPYEYTFRIIDKKGFTHWVQIHAARFLWDGKPATVNFLSEVSEKIYTQRKYQKLFDTAPLLTVELDAETLKVISVNSSFCKSVGLSSDQLIGKKASDFLPSKVFEDRYKIAKQAIDENKIIRSSDERNGKFFYNIYVPIEAPGGKTRLFVIAQDITDIRQAEQKYQRLIDSSPDAIAEVDGDTGEIITVNPSMAQNFKRTKDSLVGKNWKDLLPPDTYKSRYEIGLKTIKQNKIISFEDQRKDHYFQNIFVPLTLSKDKVNLQIISRDITNFKKTQQKLKENEEKFRTITTSAQDAIVIINGDGKITFWNKAAERIFGYKDDEILGEKVHELLMSKEYDLSRVLNGLKQFGKKGNGPVIGKTQEFRAKKKNGEEFPVELSVSSISIQDRWHAVGIVRDITTRKQMENALRESKDQLEQRVKQRTVHLENTLKKLKESEERYRSLIQTAPVAIAITDLNGNILDLNEVAKKMTGFSKTKFDFSKYWANNKDRKELITLLKENGSVRNKEYEFVRKNGEHFYGLLNVEQIKYGGKSAYLTVQQDITPLKEAEQKIRSYYDYLNNVINSTTEFIFTMDHDKKITMWNKTAESKIGRSSKKVIGKKITQLSFIKNPQALMDYIKNISTGYSPGETELIINTRRGENLTFLISVSIIKGGKDGSGGYVVVGKDVTHAKQLKEVVQNGSSYLQYKTQSEDYESLIIDLKSQGRPVLLVSRGSSLMISQKTRQMDVDLLYLDDFYKDKNHVSNCEELFSNISQYLSSHKGSIILIDRLDFLIMKSSFEAVLKTLYRITSLVDEKQAVCIIQINPDMFTTKQLNLLKEELIMFQGAVTEDIAIEESLYQILNYIYQQNQGNVVVSYSKVGKRFGISKVTTGKRISELERKGLVSIRLKGRMKSILATKKAEDLIEKRNKIE